jgi:hypothetical protein
MVKSPVELGTMDAILHTHQVPPKLAFEAEVQKCLAKYHDLLVGKAEVSVREILVQSCEQQLNSVADQYRGSWDALFALYFHTAQLHLYILALLGEKQQHADMRHFESGRSIQYQELGMAVAHRLIDIYCDDIKLSDPRLVDPYRALPKHFFIGVLLASFYLFKYFLLDPACSAEQKAVCRSKVLKLHTTLRDFTSHEFSEPGRAAAVIEALCRHGQTQASNSGTGIDAIIDDRGVASISWSALVAAANLRGRRTLKTVWLENINPSSRDLRSGPQQSTMPDTLEGTSSLELFGYEFPLPTENTWDQQMLDFSVYDFYGITIQ